MNLIFDTHTHYDDAVFDEDREELLSSLREHGIEAVTNIGASIQTSKNTVALTEQYPNVYGAVGIHPNEVEELNDTWIDWLYEQAKKPKIVAIGEIGLDYYWDKPDRIIQKKWFVRQLQLARNVKLPVVIHSRDAAKDTLDIMREERCGEIGGVIHCFSYTVEAAREYLNMGFYLGIGGVLTFNNAKKLKEVVEYMPMDRIVLETDCPYLTPAPFRGKRNNSANLHYVADAISMIKKIPKDQVIAITNSNAKIMYRIS